MLTISSLYCYQLLAEMFPLSEYVLEKGRIFLLKKKDAIVKIRAYVSSSGRERLSNEVDDNGDDVQMNADDLDQYDRVYYTNDSGSSPKAAFDYVDQNCTEYYSTTTSDGRKSDIKEVSEAINRAVHMYVVTNIIHYTTTGICEDG